MGDDVVVRSALGRDADAVRRVGLAAWPETYGDVGEEYVRRGLDRWWSPEAVRRGLDTTTTLVAEVGGEVVGMGTIDLRGEVPVLWKLYVLPAAQGRGVGSTLLRALLDQVPSRPVELEHVEGNVRAAAFYARHGFREVRRERFGAGPASVWLRRDPSSGEGAVPQGDGESR